MLRIAKRPRAQRVSKCVRVMPVVMMLVAMVVVMVVVVVMVWW